MEVRIDECPIVTHGYEVYLDGKRTELLAKSSRTVFKVDDLVVKIQHNNQFTQCQTEYDIWNKLAESDREFFVPTLAFGEVKFRDELWSWNVQPFTNIVQRMYHEVEHVILNAELILEDFKIRYRLCDLDRYDGPSARNWFYTHKDGMFQPLIFDYGLAL